MPISSASPVPWVRLAGSPYVLLTLTAFLWAFNWVLARDVRNEIGPNGLALGRWTVAALIVVPLAWQHLKRDWPLIRADAGVLMILSLTGAGGYNAVSYAGVKITTALNAMLLNATVPFFILGLSWLLLRERLTWRQGLGLGVSCLGAVWVIGEGDLARLATLDVNRGDLLVLAAMLSWAVYTIIVKRHPIRIHLLSFVSVLAISAILMLAPLAWWESRSQAPQFTPWVLAVFVYMGVGPSILCYLLWNKGIGAIGPARTGLFLYLVPVFGSVLSSLVLGEHLALFHVVGFALVLAGLWLSNSRIKAAPAEHPTAPPAA